MAGLVPKVANLFGHVPGNLRKSFPHALRTYKHLQLFPIDTDFIQEPLSTNGTRRATLGVAILAGSLLLTAGDIYAHRRLFRMPS